MPEFFYNPFVQNSTLFFWILQKDLIFSRQCDKIIMKQKTTKNRRKPMNTEGILRLDLHRTNDVTPIYITCDYTSYSAPPHAHKYYELELVLEGTATHIINGKSYEIGRGNTYILSPMDFHSYKLHSPLKAFCLNFDTSIVSQNIISKIFSIDKSKPITLPEDVIQDASAIGSILMKESRKADGGCSVELCECFLSIILANIDATDKSVMNAQDTGIQRAIAYLNTHFFEAPTLEAVANAAGYNPSYFSDIFKKLTGESYVSRLNNLRIEYSKVLLCNGARVIDACFDSGFKSLSPFLTAFKKHTGISPNEYKKRHNSGLQAAVYRADDLQRMYDFVGEVPPKRPY